MSIYIYIIVCHSSFHVTQARVTGAHICNRTEAGQKLQNNVGMYFLHPRICIGLRNQDKC